LRTLATKASALDPRSGRPNPATPFCSLQPETLPLRNSQLCPTVRRPYSAACLEPAYGTRSPDRLSLKNQLPYTPYSPAETRHSTATLTDAALSTAIILSSRYHPAYPRSAERHWWGKDQSTTSSLGRDAAQSDVNTDRTTSAVRNTQNPLAQRHLQDNLGDGEELGRPTVDPTKNTRRHQLEGPGQQDVYHRRRSRRGRLKPRARCLGSIAR
jgi:hypothetical protein